MSIKDQLKTMPTDEWLEVYRRYCELTGRKCNVYPMSEFSEVVRNTPAYVFQGAVYNLAYFSCDDDFFILSEDDLVSFNDFDAVFYDLVEDVLPVVMSHQSEFEHLLDFTEDMAKNIINNLSKCSYQQLKLINKIIED